MKKISLFAIALLAISFASCKKDRTCTCTYTQGSGTGTTVTVIAKSSKSAAQANCVSGTRTGSQAGSTARVETCTLSK